MDERRRNELLDHTLTGRETLARLEQEAAFRDDAEFAREQWAKGTVIDGVRVGGQFKPKDGKQASEGKGKEIMNKTEKQERHPDGRAPSETAYESRANNYLSDELQVHHEQHGNNHYFDRGRRSYSVVWSGSSSQEGYRSDEAVIHVVSPRDRSIGMSDAVLTVAIKPEMSIKQASETVAQAIKNYEAGKLGDHSYRLRRPNGKYLTKATLSGPKQLVFKTAEQALQWQRDNDVTDALLVVHAAPLEKMKPAKIVRGGLRYTVDRNDPEKVFVSVTDKKGKPVDELRIAGVELNWIEDKTDKGFAEYVETLIKARGNTGLMDRPERRKRAVEEAMQAMKDMELLANRMDDAKVESVRENISSMTPEGKSLLASRIKTVDGPLFEKEAYRKITAGLLNKQAKRKK